MPRGRGGYRDHSSWDRGNGYSHGHHGGRYNDSFDSRSKYDDRRRSYRSDSGYVREYRSPERKRFRSEASSSRRENYGYESGRRSYDRRFESGSRREEFRRPSGAPPPPSRGTYRGRLSSRGSRGAKLRDRSRRRLVESSYAVRKRVLARSTHNYTRKLKISRMRSAIAKRNSHKRDSSEKENSDSEKKEKIEKAESSKDEPVKEKVKDEPKTEEKKKSESEHRETEKTTEKEDVKSGLMLICPHCITKPLSMKMYDLHLQSKTHLNALRKVAVQQKGILLQMRQTQRTAQNELEKNGENVELTARTNFCPICKLNYKQRKAVHQASEAHKNMKKFLMPYCRVCRISFKSPMIYENHCCSIKHIKRKQRMQEESEEEDLGDFTTIDSVPDLEESEENGKDDVLIGVEEIKKVESYFCELCKMYLPRGNEEEIAKIKASHCKLKTHVQRYYRNKQRKERNNEDEKEAKKPKEEKVKEEQGDEEEETTEADFLNDDVSMKEIKDEAENNKSSDEDDDAIVNGERYNRFKNSNDSRAKENGVDNELEEDKEEEEDVKPAVEEKSVDE